jgi:hypothetical protein
MSSTKYLIKKRKKKVEKKKKHSSQHLLHDVEEFVEEMGVAMFAVGLCKTLVFPFSKAKLLRQTQAENKHLANLSIQKKSSIFHTLKKLVQREGVRSLWRGNSAHLMKSVPNTAIGFGFHEIYDEHF